MDPMVQHYKLSRLVLCPCRVQHYEPNCSQKFVRIVQVVCFAHSKTHCRLAIADATELVHGRVPATTPREHASLGCPLPAARCPLPAARCPLPAARCPLPAARRPLPAARCPLPAARCPLPAARCPLPAARCPLPAARCPLPAARCAGALPKSGPGVALIRQADRLQLLIR
jgi:hypothetical protein